MANDYAEVADYKARTGKSGSADDTSIQAYLDAAAVAINQFCNRADGFVADSSASARVYPGDGRPWLRIDPCTEISLVAVKDSISDDTYTSWAADDWVAYSGDERRPDFNSTPYTAIMIDPNGTGGYAVFLDGSYQGRRGFRVDRQELTTLPTVQVTAKWGYATTCPTTIKEATIAQASRWFKRGESAWADAAANPEISSLQFVRKMDVDIKLMLTAYRRARIG